jgi:8-oxo-dGTP pyrophosphatase MutT (NUDIX family)
MSRKRRWVRTVFTFLNGLRLALRKVTGSGGGGVHGVPLTPKGKVVLIRLTYAPGWRVPGGGRKRGEEPEKAMLRELREEIGLISHGAIETLDAGDPDSDEPLDQAAFFVVRDVVYRSRRSFEVEEVREFDPADLPGDTTRWTIRLVGLCTAATLPAGPPAAG